jgi:hypothetical protein
LVWLTVPEMATAGTFIVVPGVPGAGYPGGFGYARLYGHPFDDGYDYPFGYGEMPNTGPRPIAAVPRAMWCAGSGPAERGGNT